MYNVTPSEDKTVADLLNYNVCTPHSYGKIKVFMSILLVDQDLAKKCNLTSKDFSGPASILMNESHDYYCGKISHDSLRMLTSKREIHKSILMCFCCNQTLYGRSIDLREYLSIPDDINYISNTYPDFVDKVFNNISKKRCFE